MAQNTTEFHSFRHGKFDVTVLSDGHLTLPGEMFAPEASAGERADIVARLGGDGNLAKAQSNIPLIVTGEDVILIDVGAGNRVQSSEGRLEENLNRVGVDSSDVTIIVLSHAHPDRMWGVTREDGSLRFPNARYVVGFAEWSFWMGPDADALPADRQPYVSAARRDFAAISSRVSLLEDGDEVVPGFSVLATPGHTPGHISLCLEGEVPLIVTVDAAASEIVSFEHPTWSFGFDRDKDEARKSRIALLDRAARENAKLLGFHWSYPGVGRIERIGVTYKFTSVEDAIQ